MSISPVLGPAWTEPVQLPSQPRYPLRVEGHVGRVVGQLVPGVITTTFQARAYALHPLVWSEAQRRKLDWDAARALLRRCEVIVAGVTVAHDGRHVRDVPGAHGADRVRASMRQKELLDVDALGRYGSADSYADPKGGFSGQYAAPEQLLGIVDTGSPPPPGERFDDPGVRAALGDLFELASSPSIELGTLEQCSHLCVCQMADAADGGWLAGILCQPPHSDLLAKPDEARRDTIRLLAEVIARQPVSDPLASFARTIGAGDFISDNPIARVLPIAEAWRGVILRNYTVGAWRRLWAWLISRLDEPLTIDELADELASAWGAGTVRQVWEELPPTVDDHGVYLPAEADVRAAHPQPDPITELRLLLLGAHRVDDVEGRTAQAFAPQPHDDDLNPHWVKRWFAEDLDRSLARTARELTHHLVSRALRIALQKTEIREDGVWIPSRLREREGLLYREAQEGDGDVALRIDVLANVLAGSGVLDRTGGTWQVTDLGQALLAG